jgi:hypothetical protein
MLIWGTTAPHGSDILIQLMTFIYSSDGTPISSVSLFGIMKDRLKQIEEIGRNVETILQIMNENYEVLKNLRSLLYASLFKDEPPIQMSPTDVSGMKFRTQQLQQALQTVQSSDEPIETFTTKDAFDMTKNRFYFNGRYPMIHRLKDRPLMDLMIHFHPQNNPELESFLSSDFDRILGTMKLSFDFYNGLLDLFQSTILSTYSVLGVRRTTEPTQASSSSLSSSSSSSSVILPSPIPPSSQPPTKKYRKHLPDPLGFEPEYASALKDNGRRVNPCPPQLPALIAMFLKCVELTKYRGPPSNRLVNQRLIMKLFKLLPENHEIKERLRSFRRHDYNTRYVKALVQIFVNYASRDVSVRKKRITDIPKEHIDFVREEYLREHERVRSGEPVPTFEELTKSKVDLDSSLNGLFTLEEMHALLDSFAVHVTL